MKRRLRTVLLSGALITGTLGSVVVFAQANTQTQAQTTQSQAQAQAITGSVPIAQGMARYAELATVSLLDAVSAAQQATGVSTTPTSVELSIENGFLVWEVTLGNQDVLVDAGNGSVLQTTQASMTEMGESENEHMENEDECGEYGSPEGAEDDD